MSASPGGKSRIPVFDVVVTEDDVSAVRAVLETGQIAMGGQVEEFERRFADHLDVAETVALSSCTAALHVACLAAGVGPGDEVIVPSLTFVATAAAVRYLGATPVFCDIQSIETPQIDADGVVAAITDRTKAVLPVHFAGYPAPVDRLAEICDERGLVLLEDAAHVPTAFLHGRALGSFGYAGCFSFFSNKVLACGEGGAIATDRPEVAALARAVRGGDRRTSDGPALNYRLDDARAALLLSRFQRLPDEIARRRTIVKRYLGLLDELEGVRIPFRNADIEESSGYLMLVVVDPQRRREVRARLLEEYGVQTTIFPAVHELSAYAQRDGQPTLPVTEEMARSHIVLPLYPHLSQDDMSRVVTALEATLA